MKQENLRILTNEELRKICGGRSFSSINSELQGNSEVFNRKKNLSTAQKITREAAIYYKGARGIWDSDDTNAKTTWCNQSSYDVMEATGVHMEAFYGDDGKKYGIKRGAGEWVNANKACDNVEKYIDSHARQYVDNAKKNVGHKRGEQVYPINEYGELDEEALYAMGRRNCPIRELTVEEAIDYANNGYTVVVMWRNPYADKDGEGPSGHVATLLSEQIANNLNDLQVSNVGNANGLMRIGEAFERDKDKSRDVKLYVDVNQTFTPNAGFDSRGVAYDAITRQQSISVNDANYIENDYKYKSKRTEIEKEYVNGVKNRINELSELAKNGLGLTDEQIDEYINGTVDTRIATARAGLAPGQSFAGMIGVGTADQLFTDMLELNNLRETLLAEQQRLEQQGTNTALLTGEQTATATVDEPTNNEENETESSSDVSEQDNTDEYTADNSTNEQDNEHDDVGSGHGGQSEDDSNDQTTETSDDALGDETEEQTETTTPIPNDETGDDTTTTTTTGDDGGSNTGGNSGSTGGGNTDTGGSGTPGTGGGNSGNDNGGTPVAGGGGAGGGHHGPELGEDPNIGITSIGSPTLPKGFYVTRIAGLSSLNAAYEAAFEAGELDTNFFDEVSNLRTVQTVSLFARECEVN